MRSVWLIVLLSYFVKTLTFHHLRSFRTVLSRSTLYCQYPNQRDTPVSRRKIHDNHIDFDSVLKRCKYSNDYQPAIELAERALLLRPMPPSILTGVIKVFGEAGQLGRAVSILRVMKEELNVVPNEYHLGALIVACRRCGQWEMAVALYNRMDSLNITKNTIVCNNIISTLGDAMQWQSVFDILLEMDKLRIRKDIVTYSSAITAFVKAGEWEHAITLYRTMERGGVKPNTITLNAVLSACTRGRQVKMALDLFSEASRRGTLVDTISYSVVIKVCGDFNEYDISLRLFEAMEENDADAFTSIADSGDSTSTSTWNSSSQSQFTKDYITSVLATCRRVPRDAGCYNSMVTCCERAGKWRTAIALLKRMRTQDLESRPRIYADSRTYSAAISCCGKAGQWEEAAKLFDEMASEGVKKDTAVYNAMIAALQLAGQRRLAEEINPSIVSIGSIGTGGSGGAGGSGGGVEGGVGGGLDDTKGDSKGDTLSMIISSGELFDRVQKVYAEGLADGQLQHFAYDYSDYNDINLDSVGDRAGDSVGDRLGSRIGERVGERDWDRSQDRMDDRDRSYENRLGDSIYSAIKAKEEEEDRVGGDKTLGTFNEGEGLDSRSTMKMQTDQNNEIIMTGENGPSLLDNSLDSTATLIPVSGSNFGIMDITSSSVQRSQGLQGMTAGVPVEKPNRITATEKPDRMTASKPDRMTPRVLDLHRCPLQVAKAAIDYQLKEIYDDYQNNRISGIRVQGPSGGDVISIDSISSSVSSSISSSNSDSNSNNDSIRNGGNGSYGQNVTANRRSSGHNRRKDSTIVTDTPPPPQNIISPQNIVELSGSQVLSQVIPQPISSQSLTRAVGEGAVSTGIDPLVSSSVDPQPVSLPSPTPTPVSSSVNSVSSVSRIPEMRSSSIGSISRNQDGSRSTSSSYDLHIITGRGRHINSSGTRGVLMTEIKEYLSENYDLKVERIPGNDGCIIVTRDSLRQWIAQMSAI